MAETGAYLYIGKSMDCRDMVPTSVDYYSVFGLPFGCYYTVGCPR